VFLLQHLLDRLVLMSARVVALFVILLVCSLPALAAIGSWFSVVRVMEGKNNGRPANLRTLIIAALISFVAALISIYVLLVAGIAFYNYFTEWISSD
jgi:hypothetical protein